MKFCRFFIIGLLILLMQACSKEDDSALKIGEGRALLFYLAVDNSLSSESNSLLNNLRIGWAKELRGEVYVYRDSKYDNPQLLHLVAISSREIRWDVVETYSSENSASSAVFSRVIADFVSHSKSTSRGLMILSHASGWLPQGTLSNPLKSMLSDASSGSEMELSDFRSAIPASTFDFMAFESCLMAGVEVAYELKDVAKYMLASSAEVVSPGFIPVYATDLGLLLDRNTPVEQSLISFGQKYMDYVNTLSGDYRSATISLLNLPQMVDLARTVKEALDENGATKSLLYDSGIQHFDRPGMYGDIPALPRFFDFQDALSVVVAGENYQTLSNAINKVVTWKASTPTFMLNSNGFTISKHCGLTTYIQLPAFANLNNAYRQTEWYKAVWGN